KTVNLRLVTTVHGWVQHTEKTPLYFAVDRYALRRYEQVIAVSKDLFDECARLGVPGERLTFVPNAIDTDEFKRTAPAARTFGRDLPRGRLLVGAVGRLSEEKGFRFLIEAVERAVDAGCDLALWIAGQGADEERLRSRMAASRHSDRMQLLGFRDDARSLFAAFDVFALSSLREGLPNVVLEAMAMEVPVLATRSGGLGDFGRDGEDMLLFPRGRAAALAEGLVRLARDPGLRARLARAARARVERECGFAQRMKKVVAVYDRLLG